MLPRADLDLAHLRDRGTALALCGEEAQHARLPHARTALRALKVTLGLQKAAAIATGLSCSVQGRGTTRRPWSLAHMQEYFFFRWKTKWCHALVLALRTAGLFARVCTHDRAAALALCKEETQHARLRRARAAPRGFKLSLRF